LLGFTDAFSWRVSMILAGVVCLAFGPAYYMLTQDTPEGNIKDVSGERSTRDNTFFEAAKDYRVWCLFVAYGASFGVELTIINIAALYFMDYFGLGLVAAGGLAACFGLMNIFARTAGGVVSDRFGRSRGLRGRVGWLTIALVAEGITLILFSQMTGLALAMVTLMVFSIFVKMAQGATFSVVPFINKGALGSVAGIVGAGGNVGAVAAGFLIRSETISWPTALLILGPVVLVCAGLTAFVRFSDDDENVAREELATRLRPVTAASETP
jgi:NNP family nitrate/nitrite transporter-like MFS transporter